MSENYENLSDREIQERIDAKILSADIDSLSDEDIDRRIELKSNPKKSFVESTILDPAMAIGEGIAKTVDYPFGVLRTAIDSGIDYAKDKKTGEDFTEDMGKAITGNPISSQDFMRETVGVPNTSIEKIFGPDVPGVPDLGIPADAVAGIGLDALSGEAAAAGLKGLNAGFKTFMGAKKIPLDTAQELTWSANRANAPVMRSLVENSPEINALEEKLAKSPSLWGRGVRKEATAASRSMQDSANKILDDASGIHPMESGSLAKQEIKANINANLEPIRELYDSVRGSTSFIDVGDLSKDRVSRNIRNLVKFKSDPTGPLIKKISDDVLNMKNVDELKDLRSRVGDMIRSADATKDVATSKSLYGVYNKLENLEQNSILREAIIQAKAGGMHTSTGEKIGPELVGDLKLANSSYKELAGVTKELGTDMGLGKRNNIYSFLDKLDNTPDEDILKKAFDTGNLAAMRRLKSFDSDVYEILRKAYIEQLKSKAIVPGSNRFDVIKLAENLKQLSPATRFEIFGKNAGKKMTDMESLAYGYGPAVSRTGEAAAASESGLIDSAQKLFSDIPRAYAYKYPTQPGASKLAGPLTRSIGMGSQYSAMQPGGFKEPTIEGYAKSRTMSVQDAAAQLGMVNLEAAHGEAKDRINKSEKSNIDKAKELNLLNKHGRVLLPD